MKKIILVLFVMFSLLCLNACFFISEPSVVNFEVTEYQKEIVCGDTYNEDSVNIKVTYSDETTRNYSGDELTFDYSNFDSSVEGDYIIKVKIKNTNF